MNPLRLPSWWLQVAQSPVAQHEQAVPSWERILQVPSPILKLTARFLWATCVHVAADWRQGDDLSIPDFEPTHRALAWIAVLVKLNAASHALEVGFLHRLKNSAAGSIESKMTSVDW